MRIKAFASRNFKEIIRDPLTVAFGIGFPIVLIVLLSLISNGIPSEIPGPDGIMIENEAATQFAIEKLAPGVVVFGLSFISLFAGMLISKDRTSSFMLRLFTSPMKSGGFIAAYIIPLFPVAILQMLITMLFSLVFGLEFSANLFMVVLMNIPTAVMFIAIGLLCGSVFNDKQVGGFCGALLTNLSAWLSSTWFDVSMVGGAFEFIAECLPFVHGVKLGRAVLAGNYADIWVDFAWVAAYALVLMAAAIFVFRKKMNSDAV